MATSGYRLGLIGATGLVGTEILQTLEERRFPISDCRMIASERSIGDEAEFFGEAYMVEALRADRIDECELVFCAAPNVLASILPELQNPKLRIIDLSGALELDPAVPLVLPGGLLDPSAKRVAIARGVVAGLGLVLKPLLEELGANHVSLTCLEPAAGAGREGVQELSDQTIELLNQMTGETEPGFAFPQPLAFDCLPSVGEMLDNGQTHEERRLQHVLRRLVSKPDLVIDVTRVRVPVFAGSLATVQLHGVKLKDRQEVEALLEKQDYVETFKDPLLPTPRGAAARDKVRVGRIRVDEGLSLVLAFDDLRGGAALGAVLAAEKLCGVTD